MSNLYRWIKYLPYNIRSVTDSHGLGNLLGELWAGKTQKEQSLVNKILNAKGDNNVNHDLFGMASGSKKQGGITILFKKIENNHHYMRKTRFNARPFLF